MRKGTLKRTIQKNKVEQKRRIKKLVGPSGVLETG